MATKENSPKQKQEFNTDVEFGATEDRLNYKGLFFWGALGTVMITIAVVVLINVYDMTITTATERAGAASQYMELGDVEARDAKVLENFGLIDAEQGVYRVPVDSAIEMMVGGE